MPPYRDNKALPTPTLTLPNALFQLFDYILHFCIENVRFETDMRFEKGEKVRQNADSNSDLSRQKSCTLPFF